MGFTIRQSKPDDMVHVAKMIKDLANFEKMGDQAMIDEKVLIQDGFNSPSPAFHCLVAALDDGTIVGYALHYICYSTWLGKSIFLEDLYVQNDYRRQGIGKELFLVTAKIAADTSCRLDFHVLEWNPAIYFYKSLGAIDLSETEKWKLFRLDGDNLKKLFS